MSVKKSNWNNTVLTARKAILVSFGLILVISILNVNVFFTFGMSVNGTETIQCFSSESSNWMNIMSIVYINN